MKRAFALTLMLLAASAAQADPGVDLVMLIDASKSMWRDRQLAPLLLTMTLDLMTRSAGASHVEHRLAVVVFGRSAHVALPFTLVGRDDEGALRRRLQSMPAEDLGDTDVLAAFAAADALLRALPADPARRQAIVLLTDGVPYVHGVDQREYDDRLRRFLDGRFAGRTSIDILLLARGASRGGSIWPSGVVHVEKAGITNDEALAAAHAVVTRLLGTRTVESMPSKSEAGIDTLVIPPYLDVVVFDVFRGAPNAEVLIFPPGASAPVRSGVDGVESFSVGDVLSTLVVPRPPPGAWSIRRSHRTARVRVLSQQFFPRGTLLSPAPGDGVRQHDAVSIAYRVNDGAGQPLRVMPGYALAADMLLVKPDGTSMVIPTQSDPASPDNGFCSTRETECAVSGRYWTAVRITTKDLSGHRLEVFRDRWSGFSVSPATRIDCRASADPSAARFRVQLRIECTAAGMPVDPRGLTSGSPGDLFRVALWRDGAPVGGALALRDRGGGTLRGPVRGTIRPGSYRLHLSVDRARLRPMFNIRLQPAELELVRPIPWSQIAMPLALIVTAIAVARWKRTTKS